MLSMVLKTLRRHRRALAVVASWLAFATARGQSVDTAGTLPEDYLPALKTILDSAMKQSPQVISKELEVAQWEARVYAADAQRWPGVGGNMNYALNQTAISNNAGTRSRDSGLFYNFSINQPLFQWGALKNQSEIARIAVSIAEKDYAEARRSLAVALRQQYLMLIAKKALVRHGRFALKIQQADLAMMNDKLAQGTASQGDVAGRKLAVEDTSLQVARGEAEFVSLRRAFARLAGLGELTEDAVPLEIPRPAYSAERTSSLLAAFLRDGAKSTFAAEVALMRIREADLNYRIAKVRLLPKFGAQAGYSVLNTTNASATTVTQTGVAQQSVGIASDWRIFDGFATKGAKLDALATKRVHERELQTAVDTALDSAQQLARDLALDVREMDQCDIRRTLAQGGVDRTKEDIGLGKLPATALDAATANLYIAEFNCANARAKFLWQWSEFVSLAATDPVVNNLPNHYAREKR